MGEAHSRAEPQHGTYGLRLEGLAGAGRLLSPAHPDWPTLTIEAQVDEATIDREELDDERAQFRLQGGGKVCVRRHPFTATFTFPRMPADEEIVHPYMSTSAATCNRWLGRDVFHAGAFSTGNGSWAILGDKGFGKSSSLGALHARGATVASDDLLVVEDGQVLAGPRCIDLRPDAAKRLGIGEDVGVVGARERFRVLIPPAPLRSPLKGWIFAAWGETVELVPYPPGERIPRLLANLALRRSPPRPERFLQYAALPCYELRRPQDWSSMTDAVDLLLSLSK